MIKLITIDLDGTLLDNEKNISEKNKLAIKRCHDNDVKIVLATGRPINGVMRYLNELGLTTKNDYVICYNGAKTFNVGTNEIVISSTINGKIVKELYQKSKELDVDFHAFRFNEELITPKANPYTDVEATINKIDYHLFDFNDIKDDELFLKAMMVSSDENITRIIPINEKIYGNDYSILRSSKIFLEFLNKNIDKGQALEGLAKYLNININETMAIGDAGNDIPMIKKAGIGVAMENAFLEVKKSADYITLSNLNDGVSYAINKFVFGE